MWLRRGFLRWLIPAAFVLPLWLFVGWGVFRAGGWAFFWVLFLAIPSVLVGQLVLTLLVRLRPSVREAKAVSWLDVAGFSLWQLLTVALGFYVEAWWAPALVLTVLVGIALFWSTAWQLWREVRAGAALRTTASGAAYIPPPQPRNPPSATPHEVIVIDENR